VYKLKESIVRITNLTFLAFYLNGALDSGKYDEISINEVAEHIEMGSIFNFLSSRLENDIDLSIFDDSKRKELVEEWQDMLSAISTCRKFGVERNGLCLLLAYLIEGIQRRQDSN